MFDPEAGTPEQRAQQQAIAHGPEFEQWLVQKSYSLLKPICRMGMLVVALVMLAWDPMIYLNRMWEKSPQYLYLVAWQSAIFLFFLTYYCITRFVLIPGRERLVLASALALGQLLFTWFAFISWQLSGEPVDLRRLHHRHCLRVRHAGRLAQTAVRGQRAAAGWRHLRQRQAA